MYGLAISPCPNDTFAFYGLLHGKTGYEPELKTRFDDIEALNRLCFQGSIDFCKISFHAYVLLRDRYELLDCGSALGFGCGPLVVSKTFMAEEQLRSQRIAVPGRYTTATLLLKLLLGPDPDLVEMPFDHIMPAVAAGRVGAGLIIHESRFTYAEHGLTSVLDLGEWWERECGHPIPLGGIVARKSLGDAAIGNFDRALGRSIDYAWAHPEETESFMRLYAQEMAPDVMHRHVNLYVNRFTRGLGQEGRAAVAFLIEEAARRGLHLSP